MQATPTTMTPLRQLPGFLAGLLIILVVGVGLHLLGRTVAADRGIDRAYMLGLTFAVSLAAFVALERHFWLSRLMGLRHGKIPVFEALMFAVLSIVWAFVRAAGAEAEEEAEKAKTPPHPRDATRESVETIVFVVVLVLLLKLFVTEAFVIPTGSMAETLYGYQKVIECPHCKHSFPVNSHDEVEPGQDGEKRWLVGYTCPNCRYAGTLDPKTAPDYRTGDRVLVLKPLYHLTNPQRGDVVVFKYPKEPQTKHVAQNYIKRCVGFGGETLGVHRGELFVTRSLSYPDPLPEDVPLNLWQPRYMYSDYAPGHTLFTDSRRAGFPAGVGGFEIVRKTDDQVLACRRVVWDNDRQPGSLAGRVPARWFAPDANTWTGDHPHQPTVFSHAAGDEHWLRYRHLVWQPSKLQPASFTLQDHDPASTTPVWQPWTWEASNAG
ncbi:MAG: S26 family signal peptidase, partial [Gemmataceae bacterium]|nr:S26 family signal peptidase [Gemmataceae bacterium]